MTGTSFYTPVASSSQSLFPSNTYSPDSRPSTPQVFVRPNQYEPGRATITVVNWVTAATLSVDLSAVLYPGAVYEIRNAQDYFAGPVLAGTFTGSPIVMPMSGLSVAVPMGFDAPSLGSDLQVFVL